MKGNVEALPVNETSDDLPIHNFEDLSMLALMLVSGGKKESTTLYSNKSSGTESHSASTKGGSGVIDSKTPDFVLMESMCLWSWTVGRLVDVSARSLPAATACSFVVTLSAALRVPAMLYAAFVRFVCGSAQLGPCPLLACFQSFALLDSHGEMLRHKFDGLWKELDSCWFAPPSGFCL